MMHTDLWDEVNGDYKTLHPDSWGACRAECDTDSECSAWTFTIPDLCRLKRRAAQCILVVSEDNCFLPNYGNIGVMNSTSGIKPQRSVQYAVLYADRSSSWTTDPNCNRSDCNYGHSTLASLVRLLPEEDTIHLHVYVDRSIVETFAQRGRGVVTARVYPKQAESQGVNVASGVLRHFSGWQMLGNDLSREQLHGYLRH